MVVARYSHGQLIIVDRLREMVRLAAGLDRTHTQAVRAIRVEGTDGPVRLGVAADVEPQVEIWDAVRRTDLFEEVFGSEVELEWQPVVTTASPS